MGIGGSIAALLASGALLFSAAPPAQAMPPQGQCEMLGSAIDLAFMNGAWVAAFEMLERYYAIGC